jgi:hypothetical protein
MLCFPTIFGVLRYVIGGGKIKINPTKMEAFITWPTPTNVIEVGIFVGEA